MSDPLVRLYVPGKKVGSFRVLRLGFEEGLRDLGVPFATLDYSVSPDEDGWPTDGARAPLAIYLGSPTHLELMTMHADHKTRFLMLAPNGYGIPSGLSQELVDRQIGVLTPSRWGKSVIDEYPALKAAGVKATVVPHGVLAEPNEDWTRVHPPMITNGSSRIRLLHVTSSLGNRKGTDELLLWMRSLERTPAWTGRVHLTIKADAYTAAEWDDRARNAGLATSILRVVSKTDTPSWASYLRSFHGVVQPSAAEGWGLVPAECAAFGVPVATTDSTGQDYVRTHPSAFPYVIPSGPRKTPRGEPYAGHPPDRARMADTMLHFLTDILSGDAHRMASRSCVNVRSDCRWSQVLLPLLVEHGIVRP